MEKASECVFQINKVFWYITIFVAIGCIAMTYFLFPPDEKFGIFSQLAAFQPVTLAVCGVLVVLCLIEELFSLS